MLKGLYDLTEELHRHDEFPMICWHCHFVDLFRALQQEEIRIDGSSERAVNRRAVHTNAVLEEPEHEEVIWIMRVG
jgi:hypothetical protein